MMIRTAQPMANQAKLLRNASTFYWAPLIAFVGLVAPTIGAELTVVSPSSSDGVEGDINIANTGGPGHLQYLFPASDFAGLPESHRYIVKWNHRADASQRSPVDWTFNDYRIWMSTTDVDSLTGDFVADSGPDKTLVFEGAYTYSILGSGPFDGPRDFGDSTRFQTPFYYDPALGNLLIEVESITNSTPWPGPHLDFATTTENRVAFPNDPSVAAAVSQFTFIPEPATVVLAICGAAFFAAFRHRQTAG